VSAETSGHQLHNLFHEPGVGSQDRGGVLKNQKSLFYRQNGKENMKNYFKIESYLVKQLGHGTSYEGTMVVSLNPPVLSMW
jgi:hypothetical protein